MENPWSRLGSLPPFVLPEDWLAVDVFNQLNAHKPRRLIHHELMPEPFIGRTDAPVVYLALNPGFSENDSEQHGRPEFRKRLRRCIEGEPGEYPFFHLDPAGHGPGRSWWERTLGSLLRDVGPACVAQSFLCLEFFPYHSESFAHGRLRLPSQEYTFWLLRAALTREALVIVSRGWKEWVGAVPELARHARVYKTRSRRSSRLSPGNCPDGYAEVCAALKEANGRRRVYESLSR